MAGVKTEKEFLKKFPTEEAFFKAHPEAKKVANKKKFVNGGIEEGIIDPNAKSAFYDQSMAFNPGAPTMGNPALGMQPDPNTISPANGPEGMVPMENNIQGQSVITESMGYNQDWQQQMANQAGEEPVVDENAPRKRGMQPPNFNLQFSTNDIMAGLITGANALFKGERANDNINRMRMGQNPNPYGTGSQAIAKDGIKLSDGDKGNWNKFIDYMENEKLSGQKKLNRGGNKSTDYLAAYNKANPESAIDTSRIKDYQTGLGVKADGWIGSVTSTKRFNSQPKQEMTPLETTGVNPLPVDANKPSFIPVPLPKQKQQMTPMETTPLKPLPVANPKPIAEPYVDPTPYQAIQPMDPLGIKPLPVNNPRPIGKPVAIPGTKSAPETNTAARKRIRYEKLHDDMGNYEYSPIFEGYSYGEAMNAFKSGAIGKEFGGIPVTQSPDIWKERWQGIMPNSTSDQWKPIKMKEGGSVVAREDVNIQPVWGGSVETTGPNMHVGNTVQFKGPSHEKGGIGINYGGNHVEVEGGETGFVDQKGDLNVLGNLYIPGTKKKFKDAGKDIAKLEEKAAKKIKKGNELVMQSNPYKRSGTLPFGSGNVLLDAGFVEQKHLGVTKTALAELQNSILETAEILGMEPKKLVAGVKAKLGAKVKLTDMNDHLTEMTGYIKKMPDGGIASASSNFTKSLNYNPNPGFIPAEYATPQYAAQDHTAVAKQPAPAPVNFVSNNGLQGYATKAQKYINRVAPDSGITGEMLAAGATQAYNQFGKVVPVELALAQLQQEGYLAKGKGRNKPQRTNNPFNVGNTDDGSTVTYKTVNAGVNKYYNLLASNYLANNSMDDLLTKGFVNKSGNRYASDKNYEKRLNSHIQKIRSIINNDEMEDGGIVPLFKEGGKTGTTKSGLKYRTNDEGIMEYYVPQAKSWVSQEEWYPENPKVKMWLDAVKDNPSIPGQWRMVKDLNDKAKKNAPAPTPVKTEDAVVKVADTPDAATASVVTKQSAEDLNALQLADQQARFKAFQDMQKVTGNEPEDMTAKLLDNSITGKSAITQSMEYNRDWKEQMGDMAAADAVKKNKTKEKFTMGDRKLGLADILPELMTMFDTPSPVPAQQFTPILDQAFQVSFQDRLNANASNFNSVQQLMANNPAALGALAAQKYEADNAVLGEEFRTNQGIAGDVRARNNQMLNEAAMANIQLGDQAFVRQQQAISNTKNRKFTAAQSISDKVADVRLQNNNMKLMENMFDFAADDNMKMHYQGNGAAFVTPQVAGTNMESSAQTFDVLTDVNGKKYKTVTKPDGSKTITEYYDPSDMKKLSTARYGHKMKKFC